jgi:hypothetical protein
MRDDNLPASPFTKGRVRAQTPTAERDLLSRYLRHRILDHPDGQRLASPL